MARKRQTREARQQQRNKMMIAVFLAALMILSVAGIIAGNLSTGEESMSQEHGVTYLAQANTLGQQLQMVQDGEVYNFWYYPEDAVSFEYSSAVLEQIKNAEGVVMLFNPLIDTQDLTYLDMVRFDMGKLWTQRFEKNFGYGLSINDTSGSYTFPVLSCAQADEYSVVIEFVQDNETMKLEEGPTAYCIKAYGNENDYLRIRDLIVYYYLGVF